MRTARSNRLRVCEWQIKLAAYYHTKERGEQNGDNLNEWYEAEESLVD